MPKATMFATTERTFSASTFSTFAPSPLSPRDPNVLRASTLYGIKQASFNMPPGDDENAPVPDPTSFVQKNSSTNDISQAFANTTSSVSTHTNFSRPRGSKYAALLAKRDPTLEREKRRNAYLSNVKSRRDEQRWENRGESNLQRSFFDEQRAWEASRAQEAETLMATPDEFDDMLVEDSTAYIVDEEGPLPDSLEGRDLYDYDYYDQFKDPDDEPLPPVPVSGRTLPEQAIHDQSCDLQHARSRLEPSSDFGGEDYERLLLEAAGMAEEETLDEHAGNKQDVAME